MPAYTRAQVEADVTQPALQALLKPVGAAAFSDITANVEEARSEIVTAGDVSGLAFGTSVGATADLVVDHAAMALAANLAPLRLRYGFGTSDTVAGFAGVIVKASRDAAGGAWQARGVDALMEGQPVHSPLFRLRPVATATSLTSIEDPATGGYKAGLFNYICWETGGRPYEQAPLYPDAPFYYRADQALVAPEYTWASGENAWEELHRLCLAAGGQVYQDAEGTLRYVDPLRMTPTVATYHYTDAVLTQGQRVAQNASGYTDIRSDLDLDHNVTGFRCTYTERRVQGVQRIYDDSPLLPIRAGETITRDLDMTLPIWRYARVEVKAAHRATAKRLSASELTVTITARKAQRLTIQLTNTTGRPALISTIQVYGRPVAAGEQGTATYTGSSGLAVTRILPIAENPYVQGRAHAELVARMAFDFYATPRPVVTLSGCALDPDRFVGERVLLTYAPWGVSAAPHRLVARRDQGDGTMEVDLIPIADLPVPADFFVWGTAYAADTTRQLCY